MTRQEDFWPVFETYSNSNQLVILQLEVTDHWEIATTNFARNIVKGSKSNLRGGVTGLSTWLGICSEFDAHKS
jgi:hypothetical protein